MFPRHFASSSLWAALFAATVATVSAAQLGPPPHAVLSREKLWAIDDFLNGEIASGNIPGAIVLIQHRGQPVYFKCFGKRDVEKATPMTVDAIFPIHSVTKTITSVAAMMLVDRGKIALDDPVSKYIPSFAGMKVGVERKDDTGRAVLDLVPLRRSITLEDLLLHTSGITYGFYGEGLVKAAYAGIYLGDFDNAEFAERLAKVPLAEQRHVERNSLDVTRWESGGGGMVSTIADFARYAQMLLNGGTLDGKTYLSPATFAAMT